MYVPVYFIADAECQGLRKDYRQSQRAAFAKGTRVNLGTQWRSFIRFCLYFHLQHLPASLDTMCLYAQYLSRSFKSTISLRNYLHGVRLLHLYSGFEFPLLDSFDFKLLLRGLDRLHPHCPKQAMAMSPEILVELHRVSDMQDPLHVACWSAFLLAFFLMLRKSNLVPSSWSKFDVNKHLARGSILVCGAGLLVTITWSKTNQFGRRILRVPVARIPGSVLCPVSAYERLVRLVPADLDMPAFTCGLRVCVTSYKFIRVLRLLLNRAGYVASSFTGHSFRRGGATFAFQAGVSGELIKLVGDWKSDAYLRYLDFSLDSKLEVGFRMRDKIISNQLL